MPSTAGTAAGQSSKEMDRRFCEAFDLITRQVAAVSFLQFIKCNSVPTGARVPRQPNGLGRKRATSYPEDQQGRGAELLWLDLRIENVSECMSCPPKELLESYAASWIPWLWGPSLALETELGGESTATFRHWGEQFNAPPRDAGGFRCEGTAR